MKYIRPGLIILSIFIINAVLWYLRLAQAYFNVETMVTAIFGSTILIGFVMVFLLSTRMRLIVKLFGGLEMVYFYHRITAMSLLALILIHQATAHRTATTILPIFQTLNLDIKGLGELSRNVLILLIGLALLAKWMKYEHFKYIHRLMIIPYVVGLYHSFAFSPVNLFTFDYLSLWMIITSLIGVLSSIYMMLFYKHLALSNLGIIEDKTLLNDQIVELKVKLFKPFKFKPGQFAFIKIKDRGIHSHIHPFSISGSDEKYIYFTIKILGDFTKELYEKLHAPAMIHISKPYGDMTFDDNYNKHIWIAGGIGVTPFIGRIRSNLPLDVETHLYYNVRNLEEAVHLDLFKAYEKENQNFRFTLINNKVDGYLSAKQLPLDQRSHVYMCGPKIMVDIMRKQIKDIDKDVDITFEAFSFTGNLVQNVLNILNKYYKKYIKKKK